MTKSDELFLEAIETFFHSNDYNPHLFKRTLLDYPNTTRNILILEGFKRAIEQKTIEPLDWEGLTNSLIDTQEEVDRVLLAIWAYVFEEGPIPDW